MLEKTLGGRYQIISHLGGGGFGTTFVAVDRHLPGNPQCVVKQLKPKTADNPSALQAARRLFNREAEVLYQLGNHDRIPRLFAHFEEEQEFYLVQEFVEGHELKQELSAGQQLNEAQVIILLRELVEILVFVHQQNVIHRDIKPSNLIRRRQDGKVVLIDFGAVKQFSSQVINSEGETSLTIAVGSPGYMPNEQMAGKPRFCSDIFAVGIIGIQAITGISPRKLPEDPRTCEIVWRNFVQISSEFADVLDKMVRYDFRQRYQSADEALLALNAISTISLTPALPIALTGVSSDINSLPTETILSDDLSSECGIDYSRFRDLLATEKWQEADEETRDLMLKVFRKETKDWLSKEEMEKFPCLDLRTIDRLWVKYSKGHFGFSVQQRIWQSIGGKPDADYTTYCHFVDRIGWRVELNWLSWFDLTFSLNAPEGHLPVGLGRGMVGFGLAFFSRLEACGLDEQTDVLSNIKLENPTDDLSSERGVGYTQLRDLLAAGNWKEADRETKSVILQAVGREQEGRLIVEDMEKLPCSDLRTIDNLWVKYSNGRFGFSVQRRIWENMGGKKDAMRDADYQIWRNFGEQVGWRVNGSWLNTDELNFTLKAAVGNLPTLPNRRWWELSYYLISRRVEACGLNEPIDVSSNIKEENPTDNLNYDRGVDSDRQSQNSISSRIAIVKGDITKQQVDAIVNTTDLYFSGSGAVDAAIHRAAGDELREECVRLEGCARGKAKITNGYNLPARWVIHTVGPLWVRGSNNEDMMLVLAQCYRNSLALAEKYSIRTIAFPAISTGELGFPMKLASRIAVSEVKGFLESNTSVEKVVFVCFEQKSYDCYLTAVKEIIE
ncbi:GUN4 domain-containing protein [Argonema galeatum]|uniref:GUN4 domain-containing protein n=1 Tax=Argonema galeatum TaxID=2942762 RepID=UPI002011A7C4|nr:GUN4 domain-containing protein [Argonema galeatum]MCL1463409.1 GUN4 domain-containing protein [Argonema galeatum A003/A1]